MTGRVWAVVPAAGVGQRMGAAMPKQYLPLQGRAVIEHTLARLAACPRIAGVVVALAAGDRRFAALAGSAGVRTVTGGAERADSVLAALDALLDDGAAPGDLALVHDGVRPCLHAADLARVVDAALVSPAGALLATPVRDTLKRVDGERVMATVPRDGLWHALTPQVFPLAALRAALAAARAAGVQATDEAQAMERAGHAPRVVQGRADNIKITRAEDLELAALVLEHLERVS